jgi:hypothetical protein
LYYKRQQYPDFTTLFQFLNSEISSLPCLTYKTGFVRMFNALPSDVKFDVYIDGVLLAKDLEYKQFSYSIAASAFNIHNIKVFISDNLDIPIIDTQLQINAANMQTLAIVGSVENPSILTIIGDPGQPIYQDKSIIRYANLTNKDITVNALIGNRLVSSKTIKSNEYNRYDTANPETYNFEFVVSDASVDAFKASAIHRLRPTRIYTFYLVGSTDANSNYPLELIISVDVVSLLKLCPANMPGF